VIAEIGANHDQDLQLALDMISMAAEAKADAVKFQSIRFDRLYDPAGEPADFREWFRQIELEEAWYPKLAERAKSVGVDFLSSPTYLEAIDLLLACDVPAFKLASPQVQGNLPLVRRAAATGLPLILSMGYAEYGDIANALATCREVGNEQLVLLHCVSKYPAAPSEALGTHMAVAAAALGACAIEKHVTTDRARSGPDHHFALTFPELRSMVSHVREVEEALGDGTRMTLLPEEAMLREKVRLKAVAHRAIEINECIDGGIVFLRSGQSGLSPSDLGDMNRYHPRHPISRGTVLQWSDLQLI
jgi:sialic acid synthase SpsE